MFWPWIQFDERVASNLASGAAMLSGFGNVPRIFTRLLRRTDEAFNLPPAEVVQSSPSSTHPELVCVYWSLFFLRVRMLS